MTIEKRKSGLWWAVCDDCNLEQELDTDPDDEFRDCVAELKNRRWTILPPYHRRRYNGEPFRRNSGCPTWSHVCPECSKGI